MIAVILFFVAIIATAILFGIWGTSLDKKERQYKQDLLNLSKKWGELRTQKAHLQAKEESVNKKQKDADDAWEKCLAEGDRLYKKKRELDAKEEELIGVEAKLFAKAKSDQKRLDEAWKKVQEKALMGIPDAPDVIEPVDEPQKVVEKPHSPAYVCPLCGGEMYGRSDGKNTEYVCSDCGYIATVVPTDKKPAKKARRTKKKEGNV